MCSTHENKQFHKKYASQFNTFKKTRDYQSQQEAVMLGLLNKYENYSLFLPSKRHCRSVPFIPLNTIFINDEEINCNEIINSRLADFYEMDKANGIPDHTALRRKKANLVAETINFLADVIEMKGYVFESKISTGKKGIQKETLNAIASQILYLNKDDIITKGTELNKYFLSQMQHSSQTLFKKGNPYIAEVLGI
ncbi:TATA-binding protein-associated phosphoprotein, putative [Entamoeba histolytica HM-3:IMSS]|uniref:Uncharacterized protein n=4 Tax=Entamoeba histolytica TaxID=5759 RepID=C4LS95_ENTH1|nr:hypothetical protein EHI_153020 [Entamoeba histolytica HM-1:IMSS]EAL50327.1 hypothetical protein EHI_153020 [Entamoeba histolytica HM-1:IMSS]EMD44877.1 TATA-binding associated phosphoprotein, putative [Entamoeba histolytica KU27]EMS17583.1 TATA-binding protein-associated phosphoprotein, putative [Entamoeba histolytica HM-3:IMSS]GAT91555.1 hypothetical protein CL6EHI_153020 [Entamoeba histolytica]|eukprot:XP_655713.1 hypothetical protein EHI_153020 [Entamoeba histolytica HM-1:IMSS]